MKQATSKGRSRVSRKGTRVGTFRYRFEIAATVDGPFQAIDGLVDTGSLYTWIRRPTLVALGVQPTERLEFLMANGEKIYRDAAEVVIRLDSRIRHSICVFGDGKDLTLLGALMLEQFTLAVDPANKRLVPMPAIPAASTESGAETIE